MKLWMVLPVLVLMCLPVGAALWIAQGSTLRHKVAWVFTQTPSGGLALTALALGTVLGGGGCLLIVTLRDALADRVWPSGPVWTERDWEIYRFCEMRLGETAGMDFEMNQGSQLQEKDRLDRVDQVEHAGQVGLEFKQGPDGKKHAVYVGDPDNPWVCSVCAKVCKHEQALRFHRKSHGFSLKDPLDLAEPLKVEVQNRKKKADKKDFVVNLSR